MSYSVNSIVRRYVTREDWRLHHKFQRNALVAALCLRGFALDPAFGISLRHHPLTATLAAIADHLRSGDCSICRKEFSLDERQFLESLELYKSSDHAARFDNLYDAVVRLPVADGSSGEEGEFKPLITVEMLMRAHQKNILGVAKTLPDLPAVKVIIR